MWNRSKCRICLHNPCGNWMTSTLPPNWRIHNVFHALLLTPYHKMHAHSLNFTHPPPDLIDEEDKYKVEWIVTHQQFRRLKKLQYLIKWKGYPESNNTWEPADQVHAPLIVKHYQSAAKHQSAIKSTHQSVTTVTQHDHNMSPIPFLSSSFYHIPSHSIHR